jgi:hypothetical protein
MKIYKITTKQIIQRPLAEVFAFFSQPENLALITPDHLAFNIITPPPVEMKQGAIIDYTIRLFKVSVHWRTLITSFEPPFKFVDEQIKGPYSFWHHTHTFKERPYGVEIQDEVHYSIPFGILGQIMHAIWIKNDLKKIFVHRERIIDNLFAQENYRDYLPAFAQEKTK